MAPPTMRALVAAVAAAGAASLAHAQEAPGPGPASSAVTCGACTFMVDAAGVLTVEPMDEAQCVCTELDLSELGIVTLTEGVFDGLTVIEDLDLSDNEIGPVLDAEPFSNLATLTHLVLNENNIVNITGSAFSGLSSLTNLLLSNNDIEAWFKEITAGTPNLTTLSLNNNNIPSWPADSFMTIPLMDDLRLDINPFSELPADLLQPMPNLTQLEIDNAQLTSIPDTFFTPVLGTLEKLQIGDNIMPFPPQVSQLTQLTFLDMADMNMTSVPDNAFTAMTELSTLKLEDQADGFCIPTTALPPFLSNATDAEVELETGAPVCVSR